MADEEKHNKTPTRRCGYCHREVPHIFDKVSPLPNYRRIFRDASGKGRWIGRKCPDCVRRVLRTDSLKRRGNFI